MYRGLVRIALMVALTTPAALPLSASTDVPSHTETWQFAGHKSLGVHFRAGDLKVVQGSDSQHIVLRYTAEQHHQDASDRVRLEFHSEGSDTVIKMSSPNSVNVNAVLEVPGPLTLEIRMLAGDLTIERVEGSKTLLTHFGDIKVIESKDAYPQLYHSIEASTGIGDVGGLDFTHEHGWLGHSGEFAGHGSYDLRAHVGTGDIHFEAQ